MGATACANVLGLEAYRQGANDGGAGVCAPVGAESCFVAPADWTLVAYAGASRAACPPGFSKGAPVDLVGTPEPAADACSCDACTVTSSPSCVMGSIALSLDTNATLTCATAATPLANLIPGGCNTDNTHGPIVAADDVKFTPPAPTGGACAAGSPSGHPERVAFSALGRACPADEAAASECIGVTCSPDIAPAFAPCLAHAGTVECPPGPFGVAHRTGTGAASLSCSDTCRCTVTATCATATVTYYVDKACAGPMTLSAPASGVCVNHGGTGLTYGSYKYMASASAACSADGTTTTDVVLADEQTICCAQ